MATATHTPSSATLGLAVVTGASSGIGLELARCCAKARWDLIVVADEPAIEGAATDLREEGVTVEPVLADLSVKEGIDTLLAAISATGRPVDLLLANAGRGLGDGFLDQSLADIDRVLDTNVTGTLHLIHHVGRQMRQRGLGRILITGSIAGLLPGPYHAVYNASKAFLDSFSHALRSELKDTGVTVTCLMPGATETEFFERAHLLDTKIGQAPKADPADVAKQGFDAMMNGDGQVITGWQNKVQTAIASVLPMDVTAERHRKMAEPGSGSST